MSEERKICDSAGIVEDTVTIEVNISAECITDNMNTADAPILQPLPFDQTAILDATGPRRTKKTRKRREHGPVATLGALTLGSVAGVLLVSQNGINTRLMQSVMHSAWLTTLVSVSVGFVFTGFAASIAGGHNLTEIFESIKQAEWYCFLGGVLGPIYLLVAVLLTSRLGFATFQSFAIFGLLCSHCACESVRLCFKFS